VTGGRRFVLLDRDGTIMEDRHYVGDPRDVALLPRAGEGLRLLRRAGWGLVVVSNQSGVGRGFFSLEAVAEVHQRLTELLAEEGVTIDAFYVCPHLPEEGCSCRKPRPGMGLRAMEDFRFSPRQGLVVGDKESDVLFGKNLGMRAVLLSGGARKGSGADAVLPHLESVARWAETWPEEGDEA